MLDAVTDTAGCMHTMQMHAMQHPCCPGPSYLPATKQQASKRRFMCDAAQPSAFHPRGVWQALGRPWWHQGSSLPHSAMTCLSQRD